MGALSQRKGKAFERTVAKFLRDSGIESARTLTQARDSGEAPDISAPGFWVECKHHKRVSIRRAHEQAVDEATRAGCVETRIPVAITKDNGADALATMSLGAFVAMLLEAKKCRSDHHAQAPAAAREFGQTGPENADLITGSTPNGGRP